MKRFKNLVLYTGLLLALVFTADLAWSTCLERANPLSPSQPVLVTPIYEANNRYHHSELAQSMAIVQQPRYGTADFRHADQCIVYIPNIPGVLHDEFTYRILSQHLETQYVKVVIENREVRQYYLN